LFRTLRVRPWTQEHQEQRPAGCRAHLSSGQSIGDDQDEMKRKLDRGKDFAIDSLNAMLQRARVLDVSQDASLG
jgi:hypothetical protein